FAFVTTLDAVVLIVCTAPAASVYVPVKVPLATSWPAAFVANEVTLNTPFNAPPDWAAVTGAAIEPRAGAALAVAAVTANAAVTAASAASIGSLSLMCGLP